MKPIKTQRLTFSSSIIYKALFASIFILACVEEPMQESAPELITKVVLTFTPATGTPVIVSATDPDGEGVLNIAADGRIILLQNKSYALSIELFNELADSSSPEYEVTNDVKENGNEHIFFFSWTNDLFILPLGDGNMDNRNDAIGYEDFDDTGLPIGLSTRWTAATRLGSGKFMLALKHQPDIKSATSTYSDGETDLDLLFELEIQ